MEIYISGGTHVGTDVEDRVEAIEDNIGEPDAVFLEDRVSNHRKKEVAINWVAAPLLLVGLKSVLKFIWLFSNFLKTDEEIVEYFQEEYDLEPYYVDKPVHSIIGSQYRDWGLANWSLLVMPAVLIYLPFGIIGILLAIVSLITGAISVIIAYLSAVHAERNIYMMNRIAEISENNEYETACVITGREHDSDLRLLVRRFDGIELANDSEN
ncbi:hypothetical protein [Halorubrum sp. ARQ200]|uniref:hypothetical protein n=1 Tax=Halorubrum sp. ARQ200 TaxID=1855872 RepID=UPI0010F93C0B|nr:hypothetical protein [Halorubrum sp. ARQ200]TKX45818.1 hypothetical protein EXE50_01060 [Halorubrum sp. ARQ200]